ncbi:MAG TPA: hypothetical protein H9903_03370 [Candidatus Aquabacterium excrementipullorum]|nr:hypothetical protein [Candidatus Aquabacterium excrementipullorum]
MNLLRQAISIADFGSEHPNPRWQQLAAQDATKSFSAGLGETPCLSIETTWQARVLKQLWQNSEA